MAAAHRMVSIGLCLVAGMLMFAEHVDAQDPRVDLSVFGSGSFKTALSVGSAPTVRNKRFQRVSVSGANAEVSLHDRNEVACSAKKRWVLYASKGSFRSYRPGTTGGFVVTADKSRFLKDVNVGGAFETKTIQLQGVGNRVSDSADGEPLLIGKKSLGHLKMGYNKGNAWIQSVRTHLSLNPFRNHITIGTTKPKKRLTVNGHMRVDNKLVLGGASGTGSISATHLRFANGGGWYMTDKNYVRTVGGLPVFTKGAGKFMGNVGVGTLPKFPIFRLQVHGNVESKHGGVMVTDKADKGLTIGQTKEGALLRSWNIDTKKHEAMLIEAGPLLIQPRSGIVLFGTTVRKKRMHLHIRGNLYIHGHMFAMKNLHVRDHANLKHLYMPSLNLKNKPQSPDGDTLVLGHMKKKKKGASEAAPWETGKKKKVITGINLRFGFHQDYTWIQVHGKRKGGHEPLAINPLGNTVSIGS